MAIMTTWTSPNKTAVKHFLLSERGFKLQREGGGRLLVEDAGQRWGSQSKNASTWSSGTRNNTNWGFPAKN